MRHPFEYEIIYSSRKTIAIQVTRDGRVLVRAPRRCSHSYIDDFVSNNENWVLKHLARVKELEEQKKSAASSQRPQPIHRNCKGYLYPKDRVLRAYHGRLLRAYLHPRTEDPLGKLQQ